MSLASQECWTAASLPGRSSIDKLRSSISEWSMQINWQIRFIANLTFAPCALAADPVLLQRKLVEKHLVTTIGLAVGRRYNLVLLIRVRRYL